MIEVPRYIGIQQFPAISVVTISTALRSGATSLNRRVRQEQNARFIRVQSRHCIPVHSCRAADRGLGLLHRTPRANQVWEGKLHVLLMFLEPELLVRNDC